MEADKWNPSANTYGMMNMLTAAKNNQDKQTNDEKIAQGYQDINAKLLMNPYAAQFMNSNSYETEPVVDASGVVQYDKTGQPMMKYKMRQKINPDGTLAVDGSNNPIMEYIPTILNPASPDNWFTNQLKQNKILAEKKQGRINDINGSPAEYYYNTTKVDPPQDNSNIMIKDKEGNDYPIGRVIDAIDKERIKNPTLEESPDLSFWRKYLKGGYLLNPETAKSLYIPWDMTAKPKNLPPLPITTTNSPEKKWTQEEINK